MKAPLCSICNTPHWLNEPHKFAAGVTREPRAEGDKDAIIAALRKQIAGYEADARATVARRETARATMAEKRATARASKKPAGLRPAG